MTDNRPSTRKALWREWETWDFIASAAVLAGCLAVLVLVLVNGDDWPPTVWLARACGWAMGLRGAAWLTARYIRRRRK
jgi:hypothetical protein